MCTAEHASRVGRDCISTRTKSIGFGWLELLVYRCIRLVIKRLSTFGIYNVSIPICPNCWKYYTCFWIIVLAWNRILICLDYDTHTISVSWWIFRIFKCCHRHSSRSAYLNYPHCTFVRIVIRILGLHCQSIFQKVTTFSYR